MLVTMKCDFVPFLVSSTYYISVGGPKGLTSTGVFEGGGVKHFGFISFKCFGLNNFQGSWAL